MPRSLTEREAWVRIRRWITDDFKDPHVRVRYGDRRNTDFGLCIHIDTLEGIISTKTRCKMEERLIKTAKHKRIPMAKDEDFLFCAYVWPAEDYASRKKWLDRLIKKLGGK